MSARVHRTRAALPCPAYSASDHACSRSAAPAESRASPPRRRSPAAQCSAAHAGRAPAGLAGSAQRLADLRPCAPPRPAAHHPRPRHRAARRRPPGGGDRPSRGPSSPAGRTRAAARRLVMTRPSAFPSSASRAPCCPSCNPGPPPPRRRRRARPPARSCCQSRPRRPKARSGCCSGVSAPSRSACCAGPPAACSPSSACSPAGSRASGGPFRDPRLAVGERRDRCARATSLHARGQHPDRGSGARAGRARAQAGPAPRLPRPHDARGPGGADQDLRLPEARHDRWRDGRHLRGGERIRRQHPALRAEADAGTRPA